MDKEKPFLPRCDLLEKWDACMDIAIRRVMYSSLAGTFGGLLLFRSPVSRRASVAFGAGVGIGMTYSECYRLFDCSPRIPVPLTNPDGSTLESSRGMLLVMYLSTTKPFHTKRSWLHGLLDAIKHDIELSQRLSKICKTEKSALPPVFERVIC